MTAARRSSRQPSCSRLIRSARSTASRLRRMRVRRAEVALEEARAAWARVVREVGISAVARHLGVTRQAVAARLRAIERRSRGSSSR